MLWLKYAHDYSGLNIHEHKVKIEIYSAYTSRRLCPSTQKKVIVLHMWLWSKGIKLSMLQGLKEDKFWKFVFWWRNTKEIVFILVSVYKCIVKTSLAVCMSLGKILMTTMLLFIWPGRQMGINCVSKSYFAFGRYIKCDIKLSRRSYC